MVTMLNESLWGDEAWAATLAKKSVVDIVRIVSRDTAPPLYYLLEHFWMKIFGTGEVAIRMLSFIFFCVATFAVYLIGKKLWDKKTGIIAAILTATNPFLFFYAFEGRMYSLLLATICLSMLALVHKKWGWYVVATAAALYTHHLAAFAVLVQVIVGVPIRALLGVGLVYLPWVYPLYKQTTLVASGFWLGKPSLKNLGEVVVKMTGILGILAVIKKWDKRDVLPAAWFGIPLVATFLISQYKPIFYERYLLYTIPGAMLVVAAGRKKLSEIILIGWLIVMLGVNIYLFAHPTKRSFRDLAMAVKRELQPTDAVINWNSAAHHLFESKYYELEAPIYVPGGPLPFYTGTALMEEGDVIKTLPENKRIAVITSGTEKEVSLPKYKLIRTERFGSLKVLWFER